ncbi:MAG: long-chain fatty acid--CoA ligase [Thermodesulfobacteriota bacterium]
MAPSLGERPWYGDWPQGVPKLLEFPQVSLSDLLRDTATAYPNDKAIVFLDSVLRYRELDDAVDRLATALAKLGLVKGDVLALILPNSPQFVIAFYAAQRLGLAVTAINPTYKALEIKHQLNDSGAKALVVLDAVYAEAGRVLAETGVKHLIGTNIADLLKISGLKKWLGKKLGKIPTGALPAQAHKFRDLLKTAPNPPLVEIDPINDVAALQYTGGTTGTPKGAMLTSYNLVSNAVSGKAWIGQDFPRDAGWVGVLPLFHVFAMTCCMNIAVATGGFMLLFPRPPEDMHDWAAQLEKWGRDTQLCMAGVAVLFNKINNTPGLEKYDLSPLTRCLSGAGPLPREVQTAFEKKFGALVVEGYGLSESSPVVTANPFKQRPGAERVMGSIGLPFPNTDLKIMDLETGQTQLGFGPDQVGELCVKGPQVMKGYLNRPEETARTLRDGWLYTGDIAYMNDRGWTFIMDRAKDLVKHKGFSVFPKEVEDYLFSHPDVLEVAVIGLPHPKVGEVLKAFVVLKPESVGQVSEQDIIDWCAQNMTSYKVPSIVEFRSELPKTMVGKVLRRVLKEEEAAAATQSS